jgi:amino acid transporter
MNTFGVHLLKYLNNISVVWHAVGTFSLAVAILAKAPIHQSGHFVFATYLDGTGPAPGQGWGDRASHGYVRFTRLITTDPADPTLHQVILIGILMAQYTLTGTCA